MAVAKRQEREKPVKMEQKKIHGPEWEPQVKNTALLASPVCIGQAQGPGDKCIKRGRQDRLLQDRGHWVRQCMQGIFEGACHYLHHLHHSLVSDQTTGLPELCPSTENWITNLLSLALPLKTRPGFPLSQSLPSGSFQSLLSFSTRGQTGWKPQSQKTNKTGHMDHSLV